MNKENILRKIIKEELLKILNESYIEDDVIINEAGIPCTYDNVIDGLYARFAKDPKWKDNALYYLNKNYKLKDEQVEKIIDELSKKIAFKKNK